MSRLEDLAPEIFEGVAEYLKDSDLPALRLTSKTCDAKVFRHYAATLFAHRTIRLGDDASFKSIAAVVQNSSFRSAVHSVTLLVSKEETSISKFHSCRYLSSLTKVFQELKTQDKMHTLQIVRKRCGNDVDVNHWPLTLPLKAIRQSGLMLTSLTVGEGKFLGDAFDVWPIPFNKIFGNPYLTELFTDTVRNLTSLRFTVWLDHLEPWQAQDLIDIVASAPQLRHLALDGGEAGISGEKCEHIIWNQTFPTLETLEVFDFIIDMRNVVSFCQRHKHLPLKTLRMLNVFMRGYDTYHGTLRELDIEESLQSHMKKLTGMEDVDVVTDDDTEDFWEHYVDMLLSEG